jgi:hypothetical protein
MIEVGTVGELWCYPVKSMEGLQVAECCLEKTGMVGDRNWIVKDESVGELSTVRKLPKLLKFTARYAEAPKTNGVRPVTIVCPDGTKISSHDPNINAALSQAMDTPVSLWPLQPKTNLKHYRLKVPAGEKAMKKQFAIQKMPNMSSISWRLIMELAVFVTPLGRYHDAFPIHLLTSGSLAKLRALEPEGDFRVERFRPNLLIQTPSGQLDFTEFQWVDGKLYIGDVILSVVSRTVRCSMPAQAQAAFEKDAKVLHALGSHTARHLGVNISVLKAGTVRVGDRVLFEAAKRSVISEKANALSALVRDKAVHGAFKLIDLVSKS